MKLGKRTQASVVARILKAIASAPSGERHSMIAYVLTEFVELPKALRYYVKSEGKTVVFMMEQYSVAHYFAENFDELAKILLERIGSPK